MDPYIRVSSTSSETVPRSKVTRVETVTFDDPTLPAVEAAVAEVRSLSYGSIALLTVSTDGQTRPVLTFTWDTYPT